MQVVPPLLNDCKVDAASVVSLPKKSCEWLAPGWFGLTIGSSESVCEYMHRATKRAGWRFGGSDDVAAPPAAPSDATATVTAINNVLHTSAAAVARRRRRTESSPVFLAGVIVRGRKRKRSDRRRVARLVQQHLHLAGQQHRGHDPEALTLGLTLEPDALPTQVGHRRVEVVAHEAQLVRR